MGFMQVNSWWQKQVIELWLKKKYKVWVGGRGINTYFSTLFKVLLMIERRIFSVGDPWIRKLVLTSILSKNVGIKWSKLHQRTDKEKGYGETVPSSTYWIILYQRKILGRLINIFISLVKTSYYIQDIIITITLFILTFFLFYWFRTIASQVVLKYGKHLSSNSNKLKAGT